MDDNKLKSVIQAEIDDAIGTVYTETSNNRATSLEYYLREPYGNEVEGKSSIVTGEVAEAVDGSLPQIMKIFTATKQAVVFEPVNEGDSEGAEQATTYINHIFYKDNNGFEIMHDWFKDGLLQKVGVVKCYWDDKKDVSIEKYYDLTDDELALIAQDDEVEIISQSTNEEAIEEPNQIDPMTGMELEMPPTIIRTHNIKVRITVDKSSVKIENVPPEEFLISKEAKTIADSPFVAHRKMMTRSDLIAMGYDADVVSNLSDGVDDFSPEKQSRFSAGEMPDNDSLDESMQTVEYYECYLRTDYDEDGIAELRRVCYAGNEILYDEECDYIPFHSVCPIPIPHKFYGQSLADRVMDIQLIKSTVIRQMLDNLYLTNNYRVGAVEGQVNLDDLLTSTAGGVVRMKNPNAIVPLTVQSSAGQSFPMLEYLDSIQAKRTGVSDAQQGLDPNALQNVTATAVAAMTNATQGKLELIARIFANTGVSSLMKGILHLVNKYQQKERIIKVNNKFIPMNPREWTTQYNMSVNVGLGTGGKQEQLATMQMILAKQEEIIKGYGLSNPLVNLKQYRDTLAKFVNMAGFKDDEQFLQEITQEQADQFAQQASEKQSDPQVEAAEALAKAEIMKAQMKMQADQAKLELEKQELELKVQKEMLELQQKQIQFEKEMALKELELAQKAQNDDKKTDIAQSKELINALDKINNIAGM
jgi:hypothetical protein